VSGEDRQLHVGRLSGRRALAIEEVRVTVDEAERRNINFVNPALKNLMPAASLTTLSFAEIMRLVISNSIEFTRGCPWNCSFCSAWTFYGRSYRQMAPEAAAATPFSKFADRGQRHRMDGSAVFA